MSRFQNLDVDQALRLIVEGTAAETGKGFYSALVKALASTLNTSGAWVTEYLEERGRLRALAFWLNGDWVMDYEYELPGTPCETVIKEGKFLHIPDNVTQLFPRDADLKTFNAVSYMGVPLKKDDGSVLGHLAILDTDPMPADPRLLSFFRIFAMRAEAEHRRLRAESEIREREEKLSRLIGSAMDAILELDHDFNVTLVNKAATDIFACSEHELIGKNFQTLLTRSSLKIFLDLIEQLNHPATERKHLWFPSGLEAVRNDRLTLPLEATISISRSHRPNLYTLILRNVNDRYEAEKKIQKLTEQTEYLQEELKSIHSFDEIIFNSDLMKGLLSDVRSVANTNTTVLILGETGTGKELIARAIHQTSKRCARPLIKVNCAALPATLIESELFGHERGSFTGATAKRVGRFQLADGGTIFLDEVGELPLELQAKLLRVLQENEFEAVGSSKTIKVDVRVIAATNRDLAKSVEAGQFREDLYYRLNVFPLTLPPLRARRGDIALLANAFLANTLSKFGRRVQTFTASEIERLDKYDWPGNVRELQNVIERAVISSQDGRPNLDRALPLSSPSQLVATPTSDHRVMTVEEFQDLEKRNIMIALQKCDWKIAGESGAAKLLGMKPSTLTSRIASLGIAREHPSKSL